MTEDEKREAFFKRELTRIEPMWRDSPPYKPLQLNGQHRQLSTPIEKEREDMIRLTEQQADEIVKTINRCTTGQAIAEFAARPIVVRVTLSYFGIYKISSLEGLHSFINFQHQAVTETMRVALERFFNPSKHVDSEGNPVKDLRQSTKRFTNEKASVIANTLDDALPASGGYDACAVGEGMIRVTWGGGHAKSFCSLYGLWDFLQINNFPTSGKMLKKCRHFFEPDEEPTSKKDTTWSIATAKKVTRELRESLPRTWDVGVAYDKIGLVHGPTGNTHFIDTVDNLRTFVNETIYTNWLKHSLMLQPSIRDLVNDTLGELPTNPSNRQVDDCLLDLEPHIRKERTDMTQEYPVEVRNDSFKNAKVYLLSVDGIYRVELLVNDSTVLSISYTDRNRAKKRFENVHEWLDGINEFIAEEQAVKDKAVKAYHKKRLAREKRRDAARTKCDAELAAITAEED